MNAGQRMVLPAALRFLAYCWLLLALYAGVQQAIPSVDGSARGVLVVILPLCVPGLAVTGLQHFAPNVRINSQLGNQLTLGVDDCHCPMILMAEGASAVVQRARGGGGF